MRGARLLLAMLVLTSCPGCIVVSLNPLWSLDVNAEDQSLEGEWIKSDPINEREMTSLVITANRAGGYDVKVRGDRPETTKTYMAALVLIGDRLYLDVSPMPSDPFLLTSIPVHQFLRLSKGEDRLCIEAIDRKKLEATLKKVGGPISGEEVDMKLVLTAKTFELQKFFKEHGDEVFGEPYFLRRRPATPPSAQTGR